MTDNCREHFNEMLAYNKKEIENQKNQILCDLDSLMKDIANAKKNVINGWYYGIDTFCRYANNDLVSIAERYRKISRMEAENDVMKESMEI